MKRLISLLVAAFLLMGLQVGVASSTQAESLSADLVQVSWDETRLSLPSPGACTDVTKAFTISNYTGRAVQEPRLSLSTQSGQLATFSGSTSFFFDEPLNLPWTICNGTRPDGQAQLPDGFGPYVLTLEFTLPRPVGASGLWNGYRRTSRLITFVDASTVPPASDNFIDRIKCKNVKTGKIKWFNASKCPKGWKRVG